MKIKYLFYLFLLLTTCKSGDNSLYEFDPRSLGPNEITLSEIADDIIYISLDNIFQLGLIYDKIKFLNNSIYLSAKDVGILVFNKEGKTLRKIGNVGRGPGEYVYNFRFTVDDKTEVVYVWDSGDIIKVYSKTGEFQRTLSLKEYGDMIDEIESYNSKLFVSYEIQNKNVKYKWVVVDSLGKLIKKEKIKTLEFTSSVGGGSGTFKYQDKMSYWNGYFDDTIFSILPDLSEKASFIISPGEHRFPKSRIIYPNEISQYMLITQIFETDRFLMIQYIYKEKKDLVLVDKEDNKSFLTNWEFDGSGGILNDLDGGPPFLPKDYFSEKGREFMIGLIYPYHIKFLVSSNEFINSTPKYTEKKKELEKLANSLKETDNPVLVLVRLKK